MKQAWMTWGVVMGSGVITLLAGCGSNPVDRTENAARRLIEMMCDCDPRDLHGDTVSVSECIRSRSVPTECGAQVAQRYVADFEVAFDCGADATELYVQCLEGTANRCDTSQSRACEMQYEQATQACPVPTGALADQYQAEFQRTCGVNS